MKLISSEERYRTKIFWITEDLAKDPDGFEIHRDIIQHPGSAVMLAVDDKKRILMVRQYRLAARSYLWELPAGRIDAGEKPLGAAKRELEEETGYSAHRWKKLFSFFPSPGFLAEKMTIFLATGLTAGKPKPMDDERIQTQWFKAKEVDEMIRANKIMDSKSIAGFLFWKRYHKK